MKATQNSTTTRRRTHDRRTVILDDSVRLFGDGTPLELFAVWLVTGRLDPSTPDQDEVRRPLADFGDKESALRDALSSPAVALALSDYGLRCVIVGDDLHVRFMPVQYRRRTEGERVPVLDVVDADDLERAVRLEPAKGTVDRVTIGGGGEYSSWRVRLAGGDVLSDAEGRPVIVDLPVAVARLAGLDELFGVSMSRRDVNNDEYRRIDDVLELIRITGTVVVHEPVVEEESRVTRAA